MPIPPRTIIKSPPPRKDVVRHREIPPPGITQTEMELEDELIGIDFDCEDRLQKLLDRYFDEPVGTTRKGKKINRWTEVLPYVRKKALKVIMMTVKGMVWRDVSAACGMEYYQLSGLIKYYDNFGRLWAMAKNEGEMTRIELRQGEAHKRAVDGWDEPVFFKGVQCGVVRKFSDRLLELLLKGDDPAKYGKADAPNINVQTNLLMQQLKGTDCSSLIKRDIEATAENVEIDVDSPEQVT